MAAIARSIKQEESNKRTQEQRQQGVTNIDNDKTKPSDAFSVLDPAIVAVASVTATASHDDKLAQKQHKESIIAKLHTHDIGTLLTNKVITAPPGIIQEQINFLVGNTDVQNIERSAQELSQLLRVEYYEYFADYLVIKRAAL
uniref:CCR4-NOT transcription complex subunit 1 n=1 Tax=Lygus hesperus TaxID=30085 RepID=A0A0A9Y287_LYGHE